MPMDSTQNGDPQNHFSSGTYAKRVRSLLNLLNDLHDLRATQFKLNIPSVAVIGNQSSGKSSLIESICGISVPRDSGTCTRCPMRCEIRNIEPPAYATPWSAKISIEVASTTSKGTRFRTFGPAQILDPASVELWILRAQAAILNPHRDPSGFELLSREEIRLMRNNVAGDTLFVSEKLLKVVIESQDATPLTFIDLPGIVHNPPEGTPSETPHTIRRLVNKHIRKSDTIILVTIPVLDDLETQEAFQLARNVDPTSERTLGVFTKTDLLASKSTNLMIRRRQEVDGVRTFEGALGYFATRLPDDSERDLPLDALKSLEADLFETQAPWKDVKSRGRLGVKNLVTHVGGLLADLVDKRLPTLKIEVEDALAQTRAELSGLPPEPDWTIRRRETQLHLLIASFTQVVRRVVFASDADTNQHMSFVQHNIKVYKSFAQDIKDTRPQYATSPGSYVDHIGEVIEKCTTWELPHDTPYLALKMLIEEFTSCWNAPSQKCFETIFGELSSYIDALAKEHFKEFPILRSGVLDVIRDLITRRKEIASTRVKAVWELEKRVPFYTLIQDEYTQGVDDWRRSILNNRKGCNDPSTRIDLMAKALGYYHISSKRFIDYVMLTIEAELNQAFCDGLHGALLDAITSPSSAPLVVDLMAEDPVLVKKRSSIREKLDLLRGIQRKLFEHDPALKDVIEALPEGGDEGSQDSPCASSPS